LAAPAGFQAGAFLPSSWEAPLFWNSPSLRDALAQTLALRP
jgi:hypothetical protein